MPPKSEPSRAAPSSPAGFLALAAGLAGWAMPGLGHVLLRRWGRAVAYFLCVSALALTGVLLHGNVFTPASSDPFEFLGFLANLGTGVFYVLERTFGGVPDVSRAAGDYGTRFLATAGVLNLLAAIEAYEIGCGRKR